MVVDTIRESSDSFRAITTKSLLPLLVVAIVAAACSDSEGLAGGEASAEAFRSVSTCEALADEVVAMVDSAVSDLGADPPDELDNVSDALVIAPDLTSIAIGSKAAAQRAISLGCNPNDLASGCRGLDDLSGSAGSDLYVAEARTFTNCEAIDEPVEVVAAPTSTPITTATPEAEQADIEMRNLCLQHDDVERCYDLLVPASVTGPAPLVIDMHGWTSSSTTQKSISGFARLARADGFIVAWPRGSGASFNAGARCCPPAANTDVDDVGFLRAVVADVSDDHDVDANRIYSTGLSNGCAMTQRFAVEASDLVAAASCMALYLLVDAPDDYSPVPLLEIHGTADDVVPYSADGPGALASFFGGAIPNLEKWASLNSCVGEAVTSPGPELGSSYSTYDDCKNGATVSLLTVDGAGHITYIGLEADIDTAAAAWAFMSGFSLDQRS